MDSELGRFVLGTAQLGLPYGAANISGKPGQKEAKAIVDAALAHGIGSFDTASAYGDSERVLGECLTGVTEPVRVITKLPPDMTATSSPRECLKRSLDALRRDSVYGLLLHREEHLPLLDGALGDELAELSRQGLTRKLGVSVYTPKAALAALEHPLIEVVQLPASLFDRRFEEAGIFAAAQKLDKEIYIRSGLLQGVMTMRPEHLPPHLEELLPALRSFHDICEDTGMPPALLALAWLLRHYQEAFVLFGAERPAQVVENAARVGQAVNLPNAVFKRLDAVSAPQKAALLNPALWP